MSQIFANMSDKQAKPGALTDEGFKEFQRLTGYELIDNFPLNMDFNGLPNSFCSRTQVIVRMDDRARRSNLFTTRMDPRKLENQVIQALDVIFSTTYSCSPSKQPKAFLVIDILRLSDGSMAHGMSGPVGSKMGRTELGCMWRLCKVTRGSKAQPNFNKLVAGGLVYKWADDDTMFNCVACGSSCLLDAIVPKVGQDIDLALRQGSKAVSDLSDASESCGGTHSTNERSDGSTFSASTHSTSKRSDGSTVSANTHSTSEWSNSSTLSTSASEAENLRRSLPMHLRLASF